MSECLAILPRKMPGIRKAASEGAPHDADIAARREQLPRTSKPGHFGKGHWRVAAAFNGFAGSLPGA